MRIIHLTKVEYTALVLNWYLEIKERNPSFKAHQNQILWKYICMAIKEFPELKWNEAYGHFIDTGR